MKTERRFLLYRRGGIGDILGLRPLLETAKSAGWSIHGAGDPERWALLPQGLVDRVHWPEILLGKSFLADPRLSRVPDLPFDKILFFSSAPSESRGAWNFLPALPPEGENLYAYSAKVGITFFGLASEDRSPPPSPLPARGRDLLFSPGAGSAAKRWPLERFLALARKIKPKPSFLLGPAEPPAWQAFIQDHGFKVLRPEIGELRQTVGTFSDFLGNDSGPAHLAAQEGLGCHILYGPTDPALWAPRGAKVLRAPGGRLEALPLEDVKSMLGFSS